MPVSFHAALGPYLQENETIIITITQNIIILSFLRMLALLSLIHKIHLLSDLLYLQITL